MCRKSDESARDADISQREYSFLSLFMSVGMNRMFRPCEGSLTRNIDQLLKFLKLINDLTVRGQVRCSGGRGFHPSREGNPTGVEPLSDLSLSVRHLRTCVLSLQPSVSAFCRSVSTKYVQNKICTKTFWPGYESLPVLSSYEESFSIFDYMH